MILVVIGIAYSMIRGMIVGYSTIVCFIFGKDLESKLFNLRSLRKYIYSNQSIKKAKIPIELTEMTEN